MKKLKKVINSNKELNLQVLIELVMEEHPDRQDVILSLQNSSGGYWSNKAYYQFVDSAHANQTGAEWQHEDCLLVKVVIVIDVLKGGRIGGIEFLNLI
jgi:hypothetical protein